MTKLILFIFMLSANIAAFAQTRPLPPNPNPNPVPHDPTGGGTWNGQPSHSKLKTITGLDHPESVLIHGKSIFVSSMGEDTDSMKKDGYITKYNLKGEDDTNFTLENPLTSPMGMAVSNQVLYVADVNRVVALSAITGKEIWQFDFSNQNANFLNDLAIVDNRYLIITATNLKKIFCIDLQTYSLVDLAFDLSNTAPNGVVYDKETSLLYIAGNKEHTLGEYGNGVVLAFSIDFERNKTNLLEQNYLGKFLDGISIDQNTIVVSDWFSRKRDGRVYYLDKKTLDYKDVTYLQTSGLADFDYSEELKLLVTPDLIYGKVYIYRKNR